MARKTPQSKRNKSTPILSAEWQGPLPPPGALQQFDQIIPDGAERIMQMPARAARVFFLPFRLAIRLCQVATRAFASARSTFTTASAFRKLQRHP
ncbi:MAG: DUF2335 domain-containing protein [Ottowia sp.]|nr:DUF2335 domain-containing protein [Ottowia sp.]